jgi:hypothetical protein
VRSASRIVDGNGAHAVRVWSGLASARDLGVLAPLGAVVARLRRGSPPSVALLTFARSHAADDQPAVSDGAFHLFLAEGVL